MMINYFSGAVSSIATWQLLGLWFELELENPSSGYCLRVVLRVLTLSN